MPFGSINGSDRTNEEINVKKILAVIFPGYITNQFNDQLPVGLIAQLVRALHRYRRGQGSSPGKPDFFRLSFHNCISLTFSSYVLL